MTPEERARAFIEHQGDDLSRYQRLFMKRDIQTIIEEAVVEAVEAERKACVIIAEWTVPSDDHNYAAQVAMRLRITQAIRDHKEDNK